MSKLKKKESKSHHDAIIHPKLTMAHRKVIRLGSMVWAKLDGWPWWPGNATAKFRLHYVVSNFIIHFN